MDFTLEPPPADLGQLNPEAIQAGLDRHGPGLVLHPEPVE
jgi:hypothetical protein